MLSLYIHIPFCEKKCFYCSFVVFVDQKHLIRDYIEALRYESDKQKIKEINSVYFGGGTPTVLNNKELVKILKIISEHFKQSKDCEVTIEANPESVTKEKLIIMRDNGINRISLGIQSFDDTNLEYLGRVHTSDEARKAFYLIKDLGFENVNVDFIYGLPIQDEENIMRDIKELTSLGSEHVSLYSLNIEEKSKFYANKVCLPDKEKQVRQYLLTKRLLEDAGFIQYEVSNFSKKGKESKHNKNYWQCGNYIGLGVGAHSHFDGRRSWNVSNVRDYIERAQAGFSMEEGFEKLYPYQRLKEKILFGLRMNAGCNLKECEKEFNSILPADFYDYLRLLTNEGYLLMNGNNVCASEKGFLVLDEICSKLV